MIPPHSGGSKTRVEVNGNGIFAFGVQAQLVGAVQYRVTLWQTNPKRKS
jgi:hypothetical protein